MEWRTCAMVSTAHVSRSTALLLAHNAEYVEYDPVDPLHSDIRDRSDDELNDGQALPLLVNAVPYGWQVYCNTEDPEVWESERAELWEKAPDLLAIIEHVKEHDRDCMWIWLDADAAEWEGLETFDWDEEQS